MKFGELPGKVGDHMRVAGADNCLRVHGAKVAVLFQSRSFFVIAEGNLQHHEGTLGRHVMIWQVAFGNDKKAMDDLQFQ